MAWLIELPPISSITFHTSQLIGSCLLFNIVKERQLLSLYAKILFTPGILGDNPITYLHKYFFDMHLALLHHTLYQIEIISC